MSIIWCTGLSILHSNRNVRQGNYNLHIKLYKQLLSINERFQNPAFASSDKSLPNQPNVILFLKDSKVYLYWSTYTVNSLIGQRTLSNTP